MALAAWALPAAARDRVRAAVETSAPPQLWGRSLYLPAGPGHLILRRADGGLTLAGRHYLQLLDARVGPRTRYEHLEYFPTNARREFRGGDEYVEDRAGAMQRVRLWDPAGRGGQGDHRFTRLGRAWGHSSVRYVVEVPVTAHVWRNGRWNRFTRKPNGQPYTVPVNEDAIGGVGLPADLRVARDVGDHDRQKAFIQEAIRRYLQAQPQDPRGGGVLLMDFLESNAYYTFDPAALGDFAGFRFSEEVERFRAGHAPHAEAILNRPLRGFREVPHEMLWQMDLLPEATQDFEGRCVQHQLVYAVRRRSQAGGEDVRNGRPLWSDADDVEPLLDELEDAVYPGVYRSREPAPPANEMDAHVWRERRRVLERFLPAWRRDGVTSGTPLFVKGVPKDYASLQQFARIKLCKGRFAELGSFTEALREQAPTGLPCAERLWWFFKLFPEAFRCFERSRQVLGVWFRGAAPGHAPLQLKPPPYTDAGWRDVGVTSRMLLELGKRLGCPVHVIHNDHKIYEFVPEGWRESTNSHRPTALVYNVWGDHAFFYKPGGQVSHDAAVMKVRPRREIPKLRLAVRQDDQPRIRFEEMRPFDAHEFDAFVTWRQRGRCGAGELAVALAERGLPLLLDCAELAAELATWSGVWYSTDAAAALEELQARRLTVHRKLGAKPKDVTELVVLRGRRRIASVRVADDQHEQLSRLCALLSERTGVDVPYYGDGLPSVADRACRSILVLRRPHVDREAFRAAQGGRCAKCGKETAARDFEVHHRVPVSQGGGSEPENLVGLCRLCHQEETTELRESGCETFQGYVSQLSPRLANLFMLDVRKPKPWHHGHGADDAEADVRCLDLVGCRRNAIFTEERLPVFGPADAEFAFDPERPDLEADYYWVDAGAVRAGGDDAMLYQGPNLYTGELVRAMLDLRLVTLDSIVFGLRASRHVSGRDFKRVFDEIEACMRALDPAVYAQHGDDPFGDYCDFVHGTSKGLFNAMIGLWNRVTKHSYQTARSGCIDDMQRVDVIDSPLGSAAGVADLTVRTRVIGCESAFPLGLLALQRELLAAHRMVQCVRATGVSVLGVCVDGVFFEPCGRDRARQLAALHELLRERHPHGGAIYQLKNLKRDAEGAPRLGLVPRCRQKPLEPPREPLRPRPEMRVLEERDLSDAAQAARARYELQQLARRRRLPCDVLELIAEYAGVPADPVPPDPLGQAAYLVVENRGGLLTGGPGTGKTRTLHLMNEMWRARYPEDTVVNMAPTHVASRLMPDGRTLARILNQYKYGKVRRHVFFLDEVGMVALSAIARVAQWQLLGASFVMLGDFEGQFLPVADAWRRERPQDADVYRQLARSLHIKLSANRRAAADPALFEFYTGLYRYVPLPATLRECVDRAAARYPWDGALRPDHRVFAVSHRLRRIVNQALNLQFVRQLPGATLVESVGRIPGTLNQPQRMFVVPGQLLQGVSPRSERVVNGVLYRVLEATPELLRVQMLEAFRTGRRGAARLEGPITLSHRDASGYLRLMHCTTYKSAQGITLKEQPVLLLDAGHSYFDHRTLIVGLSRVADGAQLAVATPEQQRAAFGAREEEDAGPAAAAAGAWGEPEELSDGSESEADGEEWA